MPFVPPFAPMDEMTPKFSFLLFLTICCLIFGCHRADLTRPRPVSQNILDSVRSQDSLRFLDNISAQDSLRIQDSIQFEKRFQKLESMLKLHSQNLKQLEKKIALIADALSKDSLRHFRGQNLDLNKGAITEELNILALHALQYFLHPTKQGGGGKSYLGFTIPKVLEKTENATYKLSMLAKDTLQVQAISAISDSWIAYLTIDENGTAAITYSGFDEP
jgi:hypothetical protein